VDKKKGTDYYSFLLRLWRVKEQGRQEWRASLENVGSCEKRGFDCLEELLVYLNQVAAQRNNPSDEGSQAEVQD
jgi:hypothetical protein